MGTTIVGVMFSHDSRKVYVGHVGDSRVYRIRGGAIQQLTRDHSLVNDYLAAMPDMTDEQRSELPKNVITRALGMQDSVEVDIQSQDVNPGDVFVLCSDGLSGMITDDEIRDVILQYRDPEAACQRLVTMANEHGGEDNITAVVVRAEAGSSPAERMGVAKTQPLEAVEPPSSRMPRVDQLAKTPPAGLPPFNAEGSVEDKHLHGEDAAPPSER
jgi:protein phosphatase